MGLADDGKRNGVHGMEMDVFYRATCCLRGVGLREGGCRIRAWSRPSDSKGPLSTALSLQSQHGFHKNREKKVFAIALRLERERRLALQIAFSLESQHNFTFRFFRVPCLCPGAVLGSFLDPFGDPFGGP